MKFSCFYGIDTPSREELIANSLSLEEINHYITSDSLGYLSIDGIRIAIENHKKYENKEFYCNCMFYGELSGRDYRFQTKFKTIKPFSEKEFIGRVLYIF